MSFFTIADAAAKHSAASRLLGVIFGSTRDSTARAFAGSSVFIGALSQAGLKSIYANPNQGAFMVEKKWIVAVVAIVGFLILLPVFYDAIYLWSAGGTATDARTAQSEYYWKQARPFQIEEYSVTPNGTCRLTIRNAGDSCAYTIDEIKIGNATAKPRLVLAQGEKKTLAIEGLASGKDGGYDFPLSIWFTSESGQKATQTGAKNLVGPYK